ncbi:4'-phosphopantetheinyl transferase family protein [Geomonas edaphica]|uniref:4'-phosphopantetheinyl transferase family protein n=1 Tax=Geomonas edaphica TaxID=2570226 RepID=UPI0010A80A3C|nr:4'-phosphopantetheinyl transferase superfamily protein [Geomonas edaphica]
MRAVAGLEDAAVRYGLLSLDRTAAERARLESFLSDAELRRGARLLDAKKRDEFLVGRGLVREVLAGLLRVEPREVEFSEGEFGKPFLRGEDELQDGRRFNVSHSGGMLLLAATRGCEIGVDLEEIREDLAFRPMAERYFSLREKEELFGLDPAEQLEAFYRCWTRKEAYMKGTGSGFSQPSTGFDVSLLPGEQPAMLAHRGDPREVERWSIVDLDAGPGYCAALACERP